jgi:hypothetical protein
MIGSEKNYCKIFSLNLGLNEIYSKVRIGSDVADVFSIQSDLTKGDVLPPLLFNIALEYAIRNV